MTTWSSCEMVSLARLRAPAGRLRVHRACGMGQRPASLCSSEGPSCAWEQRARGGPVGKAL